MKSRNEIADMTEKMTQWIVDHMDHQELIALAYEIVAGNISELPDEEIRAQFASMFDDTTDPKF